MESMFHSKTNENIQTQLERLAFQKGDDKEKERAALQHGMQRGDMRFHAAWRRAIDDMRQMTCNEEQRDATSGRCNKRQMQQAATRCNKRQRCKLSRAACVQHRMKRNALLSGLPSKRG